jgi:light-regulated signal transduction histidine kinase (bacteriophytochrome)
VPAASSDGVRQTDAEQELQAFSYIVSHDLSASFRHVAEFSRLLLGEIGDGLTSRQRSHADRIGVATEKCQAMMEQLLAFSRVQQKALSLARRDPTSILRTAMLRLSGEIQAAGAEISIAALGEAHADMDMLAQAFEYLLDNAIKFRRPGVRPRITVEADHDEAFWRLRVTDNGLGVEPAFREKAFRMFHRLNGEDAYPGVGAGLTISRRIARRHGGDVRFVDCDEGACVELVLPRAEVLH